MSIAVRRSVSGMSCAAVIALLVSCAGPGAYVWYNELSPSQAQPGEYLVDTGDLVDVRVLAHEEMTVLKQKVRADGRISVPIVGDVEARGKRPSALRAEIEARLKDYFVSPSVMVSVEEATKTITCLGEVGKPGAYPLEPNTGLARGLALAGGLTDFASRDRIFVIRLKPTPMRIRFTYAWILRNQDLAAAFPLRPGDLIVVE
jgi:polysaccharide export outer membrane protein